MAMINCRECGSEISNQAVACPSCGCPINATEDNKGIEPSNESKNSKKKEKNNHRAAQLALMTLVPLAYIFVTGAVESMTGFYLKWLGVIIIYIISIVIGIIYICKKEKKNKIGNIVLAVIAALIVVFLAGQMKISPEVKYAINNYSAAIDNCYLAMEEAKAKGITKDSATGGQKIAELYNLYMYSEALALAENSLKVLQPETYAENAYLGVKYAENEYKLNEFMEYARSFN